MSRIGNTGFLREKKTENLVFVRLPQAMGG
jgi:hypothetical protein